MSLGQTSGCKTQYLIMDFLLKINKFTSFLFQAFNISAALQSPHISSFGKCLVCMKTEV